VAGRLKFFAPDTLRRLLERAVVRGNRAGMLRAVAFADPGGPARWGS
jgi:hypothetical protein